MCFQVVIIFLQLSERGDDINNYVFNFGLQLLIKFLKFITVCKNRWPYLRKLCSLASSRESFGGEKLLIQVGQENGGGVVGVRLLSSHQHI